MVKFIFAIALLIPIVLVFVGIVQSISLQIKKNTLSQAQTELQLKEDELKEKQDTLEYLNSDEYKGEYYSHEGYDNESYGKEGDIEIIIN